MLFAPVVAKFNTKVSMMIGVLGVLLSSVPLFFVESNSSLIFVWIFLQIAGRTFYYLPYFYYLSKLTSRKKRGSQIGLLNGIIIFSLALAPLISGVVSDFFGIKGLISLTFTLSTLSLIPLFFIDSYKFKFTGDLNKIFSIKSLKTLNEINFINNGQENLNHFWHIYIFVLLGANFEKVGLLFAVVISIGALSSYIFGKFLDHHNRRTLIRYESIINSLSWMFRYLSTNVFTVFLADTFYKVNKYVKDAAIDVVGFDLLNHKHQQNILDEKIVLREIIANLSIAISLTLGLVLALTLGIQATFLLAALISLFFISF